MAIDKVSKFKPVFNDSKLPLKMVGSHVKVYKMSIYFEMTHERGNKLKFPIPLIMLMTSQLILLKFFFFFFKSHLIVNKQIN